MTLKSVWLVVGETGEYSDQCEWVVTAHLDEGQAREHARLANEALGDDCNLNNPTRSASIQYQKSNPYDPRCQVDYTGTSYRVCEIPFVPGIDDFLERVPDVPGSHDTLRRLIDES